MSALKFGPGFNEASWNLGTRRSKGHTRSNPFAPGVRFDFILSYAIGTRGIRPGSGSGFSATNPAHLALGVAPADVTILLHPIALAGWFGLFVTFLNLLPVGQLDGGHVVYALLGRRHRWVARLSVIVIVSLAFLGWQGWMMWAVLVTLLGLDHPPTVDDTPLDPARRIAAWATIALFAATFMPVPLAIS